MTQPRYEQSAKIGNGWTRRKMPRTFPLNIHTLAFVKSRFLAALKRPVKAPYPAHVFRTLLLKPPLFDLASLVLQVRDLGRLAGAERAAESKEGHKRDVLDHNYGTLLTKRMTSTRRMEPLYRAVASLRGDLTSARLLAIGSRNVHELFVAWLYGFSWPNIEGIDLYSAHPKIHAMDMEDMTFKDCEFDIVVMALTLNYASDVRGCLEEVSRVLKPGGLLAFTSTNTPEVRAIAPGANVPGATVLQYIKDLGLALRHYEPTFKITRAGLPATRHLFGVEKLDPGLQVHDRVELP